MNYLTVQEQKTYGVVKYLKRLKMELETIQAQLKTGELKITKGKRVNPKPEGGKAAISLLTTMQDIYANRHLVPTGKKLTGSPLKNIPELLPEDIENIKMRVFSAEFPKDDAVIKYQKSNTIENRLKILIRIETLEKNVTLADWMDLHGMTTDFLMERLKQMINTNDKQLSQRFLAMAFNLKFPQPDIKIGKAIQENSYNFGSKRDAVKAVKKQMEEIVDFEGDAEKDERGEYPKG